MKVTRYCVCCLKTKIQDARKFFKVKNLKINTSLPTGRFGRDTYICKKCKDSL